jgi:hypothetical protein
MFRVRYHTNSIARDENMFKTAGSKSGEKSGSHRAGSPTMQRHVILSGSGRAGPGWGGRMLVELRLQQNDAALCGSDSVIPVLI